MLHTGAAFDQSNTENILGERAVYIDTHAHVDAIWQAKAALNDMETWGIRKMLIMPPPYWPDRYDPYYINALVDIVKKYPDRFAFLAGGATLNVMIQQVAHKKTIGPALQKKFEKKAVDILAKGAIGFGELAAEHLSLREGHPYMSAPPDHPLFLLLADIAAQHNVPIDIHMEAVPEEMPLPSQLSSPPNPRVLSPNIAAFERLLAHNRKAKIIWSHVGWDQTGHRTPALTRELLHKHPNLFMNFKLRRDRHSRADNCPVDQYHRIKPEWLAVMREFPDRFLIGTDVKYLSGTRQHKESWGMEETMSFASMLPPDLIRAIGYKNARNIFKLDE